jgi:HAD superfamily hydrolase (TIGR01509 family)
MIKQVPFIPTAVIFDMDGLMLDTEKPMITLWIEASKKFGLHIDLETAYKTVGLTEEATRSMLFSIYGDDFPYAEVRKEWEKIFSKKLNEEGIDHRPGLVPLLDHLDKLGVPLGVATSTVREVALWKLEKANVSKRFNVITCGDEVKNGKPAPDIFLLTAERLGVPAQSCIGFEDSPAGLKGLHSAGIPSIFIKDLIEPPEEILSTVWKRLDNLAEAIKLFA